MTRRIDISQKHDFNLKNVLVFPYRNYHLLIDIKDIMYVKAEKAYSKVVLNSGEAYLISRNIKYLLSKLPTYFVRTHNSYLVNVQFAESMIDYNYFVLQDKSQIPISRRKKKEILDSFSLV